MNDEGMKVRSSLYEIIKEVIFLPVGLNVEVKKSFSSSGLQAGWTGTLVQSKSDLNTHTHTLISAP